MKILRELTLKNLKLNKKRTIVTIIGIMLSVALICAVGGMIACFRETLLQEAIETTGYNHIITTGNRETLNILNNNREIKQVINISNLGYSYLKNSQNEYKPYLKLFSIENPKDFLNLPFKLVEGRYPANSKEIVISETIIKNGKVNYKIGDTIEYNLGTRYACGEKVIASNYLPNEYKYDDNENIICEQENLEVKEQMTFKIVGIIERPNYDFEHYEEAGYTTITVNLKTDDLISYSILKNPKNYQEVYNSFEKSKKFTGVSLNNSVLHWEVFKFDDDMMQMLFAVAGVVIGIILVTSIFCIRNSFAISTLEKIKMFGHLASVGATKKQIRNLVLKEAFYLGIIAIPLGIICGILADYLLILIMNYLLKDSLTLSFAFRISIYPIIISIILGIITIYLSSIASAIKASRVSPIEAIRNNQEIKIKNNKLKTPWIIKKLFKTSGEIAYKNLKRSKKKYRTTVISLVVSILTFITMNTFINYGFKITGTYYTDFDYDIEVQYDNPTEEDIQKILSVPDIKEYNIAYDIDQSFMVKDLDKLTDIGKKYYINKVYYDEKTDSYIDATDYSIRILLLENDSFNKYIKENNLNSKKIGNKGILVDTVTYEDNKKTIVNRLTNYKVGEEIKGLLADKEFKIQISNILDKQPKGYEGYNNIFLILNKEYYQDLNPIVSTITLKTDDADKLEDNLEKLNLELHISNISKIAKEFKSMILIYSIFLYGFITVITLIGVTNIFNTITTNMTLRQKEFATLKSIGVTKKEFNKIINLEIFFYCFKSLFFGIILGIIGSFLVYKAFSFDYDPGFILPGKAIIISIIFVVLLVTIIMKYSISKINKQNIIETIRNENI